MSEKKLTEIIDAETKASEQTQGNPSSGVKQRSGASAVYSLRPPADKIRETARGSRLDWCATHCPPSKTGSSNDSNTAPNETLRKLIHTEVTQAVAEAIETKRAVHCDADAKTRSTTECWSTPLFRIGGPMRPEAGWPFASGPGQDFRCSVRQAQQTQRGLAVAAGLRTQRQPGSMVVR